MLINKPLNVSKSSDDSLEMSGVLTSNLKIYRPLVPNADTRPSSLTVICRFDKFDLGNDPIAIVVSLTVYSEEPASTEDGQLSTYRCERAYQVVFYPTFRT
jgi:hypothetical protein